MCLRERSRQPTEYGIRNQPLDELQRLENKTLEARFLTELTHGLNCSRFEGQTVLQVARETYHCLESVDRYPSQYDRVRHRSQQRMNEVETAHILGCGQSLVREHLRIDDEINTTRAASAPTTGAPLP